MLKYLDDILYAIDRLLIHYKQQQGDQFMGIILSLKQGQQKLVIFTEPTSKYVKSMPIGVGMLRTIINEKA